ncbi:hypothetical protein ACN263_05360 [Micromonospora sp. WMMD729]|uniref:hypothetical protein n=1 Tax=Micromonospora sp. WMMD729 TaxID=3404127 RepID=UPI003BF52D4A
MPASTRHHRALAVFVHCLGILAAVPALPAAAPEAAAAPRPAVVTPPPTVPPAAAGTPRTVPPPTAAPPTTGPTAVGSAVPVAARATSAEPTPPSAPPAVATPTRAVVPAPPPPVTVAVAPESSPAPRYRIHVRNVGNSPVDTTVRQELPSGSSATAISAGGRSSRSGGSAEVTWRLRLPAHSSTTLGTALTATAPGQPLTAPACAFTSDGSRPYDCATATWQAAAAAPAAEVTEAPPWRRYPVLLAGLGILLLISAMVAWVWRRRRGRRGRRITAAALADGGRGTIYPRPATPSPRRRRRTPPVWLLVGGAVVVLAGVIGTAGWTATRQVSSIDTQKQPTSGAWRGTGVSGPMGVPLRESAFEFTVYRMTCGAAGSAATAPGASAPPPGARSCQATVGVRNLTGAQQPWHGQLQRAYLPGNRWVSTDESATRAANLGRDVFANPVAAGSRVVLPLVFTVDGRDPPRQLELRSGVFSAGVRVQMP